MIDDNLNLIKLLEPKLEIYCFIINLFLKINVEGADTQAGLKAFKKVEGFDKLNFYSKNIFLI